MGDQCRELAVTLRIADLDDDPPAFRDTLATWLLGHTQRISFGRPYVERRELLVDAVITVPCKFLQAGGDGGRGSTERCRVHGFARRRRGDDRLPAQRPVHANGKYRVFYQGRLRHLDLPPKRPRALPVVGAPNPCVGAPCRTADNAQGAACCRDLTVDVVATLADELLESLLRSRKSPYLCKVTRTDETTLECEVISACAYLDTDGIGCVLHDRLLPDGQPAKPSICYDWPDPGPDGTTHPGCRLAART
jgi:hypothetical protein